MQDIEFLRLSEGFNGLADEQLAALAACVTHQTFQEGEKLFSEKEAARFLWIVKKGTVALRFDLPGRQTSSESTISTVGEKMMIGWSSLVPPYKYTLSSYCTSRTCEVVKLETACLNAIFEKEPRMGYQVKKHLIHVVGSRFQSLRPIPAVSAT